MKIVTKFQLKIVIFTAVKNRCILHGRVFVMFSFSTMWLSSYLTGNQRARFLGTMVINVATAVLFVVLMS